MTPIDRAVDFIKGKGFARTPDIARVLSMLPDQVDELLKAPTQEGYLITCAVEVGDGQKVTEYRLTSAAGGTAPFQKFTMPPKKTTAAERAPDRAPKPVTTPSPARPAAPVETPVMAEKKSVTERVLEALKKHGHCNVHQLAKHTGSTPASLSTYLGKIKGVVRVSRGVYGLSNGSAPSEPSKPRQRDALASGGELGRKTPYAATIAGLAARREALLAEVAKVDRAIEAVKAIA